MFHGVEPEPLSPPCWHVIDVGTLRRQLEYVRRHFRILPLEEALERLAAGTLPDHAAAVTFDDGTRNLATHAGPVLRELGVPASLFLSTGVMGTDETLWPDRLWLAFARTNAPTVDLSTIGLDPVPLHTTADRGTAYWIAVERLKDVPDAERMAKAAALVTSLGPDRDGDPGPFRMLSWEEAHSLAQDGLVTLHPHTVTHPILSRCADEKVEHEIAESCATVERHTGSPTTVFAYPNGRAQDFDDRAKAVVRRCGAPWALSTIGGFADRDSDPLALPRIPIGSTLSFAGFKLVVSGAGYWRRP